MGLFFSSETGTSYGLIKHSGTSGFFDGATKFSILFWSANEETIDTGSVWMKYSATTSDGISISSFSTTNRFVFQMFTTADTGRGRFGYVPSTGLNAQSTYDHFAIVYDGTSTGGNAGRLKMYLNAASANPTYDNTIPASVVSPPAGTAMQIGNTTSSGTMTWNLAHLMIYNRVLSSQEIATQMIRRIPLDTTSLVFWAPYDAASLALLDLGPSRLHGTTTMSGNTVMAGSSSPPITYGHPVSVVM